MTLACCGRRSDVSKEMDFFFLFYRMQFARCFTRDKPPSFLEVWMIRGWLQMVVAAKA
jgi:hypothetical protein